MKVGLAVCLSVLMTAGPVMAQAKTGKTPAADKAKKRTGRGKGPNAKGEQKKPADDKAAADKPADAKTGNEPAKDAPKQPAFKKSKKVTITWLGHAAFEIISGEGTRVLIDPFLKNNPATPEAKKDLAQYKPKAILVTHSHGDHLGDAVEIAKASGAPIVGDYDMVSGLKLKDDRKMGGNVGGKMVFDDVEVHIVPAVHGSQPGGRPVGYVLKFKTGQVLYHTGDTWIFSDMALINEIHKPTILLMNCGGGPYTQDPATCGLAMKKYFKKAKAIVPMHFGTFPPLATEADVQKALKKQKKKLKLMKPGDTIQL